MSKSNPVKTSAGSDRTGRRSALMLLPALAVLLVAAAAPPEVAAAAPKAPPQVQQTPQGPEGKIDKAPLALAYNRLRQEFDAQNGGFGGAPKFPHALELGFLLNYAHLQGQPQAYRMAAQSLTKMARGGIYDQLGGGFFHDATDARWLAPHFEKTLYDNALLVPLYLAQDQIAGNHLAARVARETLDFVLRDLGALQGGFFASVGEESQGQEGKYYFWSLAEIRRVVGAKAAPVVAAALGVTKGGNFEGNNILTRPFPEKELATRFKLSEAQLRGILNPALARLRQARARRVPPVRDDQVITAWNGLMISALAQGTQILGDRKYYQAAARTARFILAHLVKNGRLYHVWTKGQVGAPGFLDDYAFLANGLLDLFETDFDPAWLVQAQNLTDRMNELFLDPQTGVYVAVGKDQPTPTAQPRSIRGLPSGDSMAALVCLRLQRLTGKAGYQQRVQAILARFQGQVRTSPLKLPELLTVQDLYLVSPLEITVVGNPQQPGLQAMLRTIYRHFLPERRLVLKDPKNTAVLDQVVPGLKYYTSPGGQAVVYLCRNSICLAPLTDPKELAAKLEKPGGRQGQ
jgi:uncharacterized protein YyaL (SSP411 family)